MGKLDAKWIGFTFLTLWVLLVLFLYLTVNWTNVDYCLRTYVTLFRHTQTLFLVSIPCLVLASIGAIIYLARFFMSKRT